MRRAASNGSEVRLGWRDSVWHSQCDVWHSGSVMCDMSRVTCDSLSVGTSSPVPGDTCASHMGPSWPQHIAQSYHQHREHNIGRHKCGQVPSLNSVEITAKCRGVTMLPRCKMRSSRSCWADDVCPSQTLAAALLCSVQICCSETHNFNFGLRSPPHRPAQ